MAVLLAEIGIALAASKNLRSYQAHEDLGPRTVTPQQIATT